MSLLAVILVLREHKEFQKTGGLHLFMAALAVIESWLLIHTVFTLRYAHVFYRSEQEADVEGSGGGLIFPGGHNSGLPGFRVFFLRRRNDLPSVRCERQITLDAASGPTARPPLLCLQHGDPRLEHQHHFWLLSQLRRRRACPRRSPMKC
jgi:hypothetical protein